MKKKEYQGDEQGDAMPRVLVGQTKQIENNSFFISVLTAI